MQINAIKCLHCGDIIYSRARHDFHTCSCDLNDRGIAIDGGFDLCRICQGPNAKYKWIKIEVNATKQELYQDWNTGTDKFGLIKGE
jgi:hypothetical protein